jgi:hypothetical protein
MWAIFCRGIEGVDDDASLWPRTTQRIRHHFRRSWYSRRSSSRSSCRVVPLASSTAIGTAVGIFPPYSTRGATFPPPPLSSSSSHAVRRYARVVRGRPRRDRPPRACASARPAPVPVPSRRTWLVMSASCRQFFSPKTMSAPTCQRHVAVMSAPMSATFSRVGSSDAVSVSCRHDDLPTCRGRVVDHGCRPPCPLPPPMPLQRPIHRFGPAGYIIRDVMCARFAQNRAGSLLFHWFENKGN